MDNQVESITGGEKNDADARKRTILQTGRGKSSWGFLSKGGLHNILTIIG